MNNTIIKFSIISCLLLLLGSCSIEDIEPINQLTEDNVIRDQASAEAVINRVYTQYRGFNFATFASAVTYAGVEQDEVFGVFGGVGFFENNVQDDSNILKDFYKDLYAIINNTNFLIDQLEKGSAVDITEERKNELLGEAKALRGLAHFYILRIWGQFYDTSSSYGVVVSTSPIREIVELPRSSVQATYDAIVADLEFAAANAPSGRERFYINATAAEALLAKVQLYMGDYAAAATTADRVINNTDGFALAATFSEVFNGRWESEEILFAPFVDGFNEGDAATTFQFGSFTLKPSLLFRNLADYSDGIAGDGDPATNATGYDARFSAVYDLAVAGPNQIGKYPFVSYNPEGGAGNTYYHMRMAEVYLIYAEAETRRSGGDLDAALARLNDVRNRAGVPTRIFIDEATLLEDIRNEKMLELFIENGETWFDLVRYDRLGDVSASDLKPTITSENKLIFPIPAAALAGNSKLVQNP